MKLDRIGRSLPHVVHLVSGLRDRDVGLRVLTGEIDTTNSTGRLVFGIFAVLAKLERGLIRERTVAGLAAARAGPHRGGQPRMMIRAKLKTAMTMMADQDNTARDVADQLGLLHSTLYTYVDGKGRPKPLAALLFGRQASPPQDTPA